MKKGTKLYSVVKMRCPHCHEGKFFKSSPYNLRQAGNIHDNCSECGGRFSLEPGFYYGAMYVAYALGVATIVAVALGIYSLNNDLPAGVYIGAVVAIMVLLGPLYYALSKIIWANMFMSYKDSAKRGKKKESYES